VESKFDYRVLHRMFVTFEAISLWQRRSAITKETTAMIVNKKSSFFEDERNVRKVFNLITFLLGSQSVCFRISGFRDFYYHAEWKAGCKHKASLKRYPVSFTSKITKKKFFEGICIKPHSSINSLASTVEHLTNQVQMKWFAIKMSARAIELTEKAVNY
jgi:hypothetical protein